MDIVRALQSCKTCLTYNVQRVGYHPLQQLSASLPFDVVHLDLFGPLPVSSQGNRYVLLAVDSLSRFVVLRPLKDKSALSTAQGLYSIFVDFGFPKTLISDNGAEFVNQGSSTSIGNPFFVFFPSKSELSETADVYEIAGTLLGNISPLPLSSVSLF